MSMCDVSSYTYERTLLMEQRNEMLKEMRVSDKRRGKMVSTQHRCMPMHTHTLTEPQAYSQLVLVCLWKTVFYNHCSKKRPIALKSNFSPFKSWLLLSFLPI